MREPNVDAVISVVHDLLAGALDCGQLPVAVERLRQLFDGSKACFAKSGPDITSNDIVETNPDPGLMQRAFGDLAGEFLQMGTALRGIPVGQIYNDNETFGVARLRASRVWQEWMEPQDMYGGLASRLSETKLSFWFFDVQGGRTQSGFDAAEATLLEKLAPVLRKVAEIRQHLGVLSIQRDEAHGALDALSMGIVVVDREMRISYTNAAADDILADPTAAIGLHQGRVFARRGGDQKLLKRLVESCHADLSDTLTEKRCSMIARGPEPLSRPVSTCVMPADVALGARGMLPRVMIGLRPLGPPSELAASTRDLFDLTEAEAKFAAALASGLSLAEAAEAQGVRISTARTHLARVFQKTQTHQQSQLVSLLQSAALPFRPR